MIASGSEPEEFEGGEETPNPNKPEMDDLGDLFDDDPLEDISLDAEMAPSPVEPVPVEPVSPPPAQAESDASSLSDIDVDLDDHLDLSDQGQASQPDKSLRPEPPASNPINAPASTELSDIEAELDLGGGFGNPGLEESSLEESSLENPGFDKPEAPASHGGLTRMSLDDNPAPNQGYTQDYVDSGQTASKTGKTRQPPRRAILKRGIRCPYCQTILPDEDQIHVRKDRKKIISNLKEGLKQIDADNPHVIGETVANPEIDLDNLPKCPNCKKEYIPREIEEESKIWGNATSSTGLILLVASGASMLFLAFQIIGYYFIPAPDPDKGLYEDLSLWMAIVRLGQTSACCVQPASFCALGLVAFDYFFGSKSEDSFKTKLYTVFAIIVSIIGLSMVLWASMSMTSVVD